MKTTGSDDRQKAPKTREAAAAACAEVLDTVFFKALCEPARIALLRQLVLLGRADVGTLAAGLPQDRSVIARHLQLMERAGLVRCEVEGRSSFYELEVDAILHKLTDMTELLKSLRSLCCPVVPIQRK
jgi:DNA-binding transcriptional ArsR family regulator